MSPKILYVPRDFAPAAIALIEHATRFIGEYEAAGYTLTLRQLYYRFVAADYLPNTVQSYKRLGSILNDGRLAGLIDWNAIEDRTRNLQTLSHWDSPADIIQSAADSYRRNAWEGQETRVEVWVEKDALVDVVGRVANRWDLPYFACRGYVSQSEMWSAAQRLKRYKSEVVVLHLGDHDPSGIDMTRDIQDRLSLFGARVNVDRIALNMNQVEQYEPPPNPAKTTDSRYAGYIDVHGPESWELDALEPAVLDALIEKHILVWVDREKWNAQVARADKERERLTQLAKDWNDEDGDA